MPSYFLFDLSKWLYLPSIYTLFTIIDMMLSRSESSLFFVHVIFSFLSLIHSILMPLHVSITWYGLGVMIYTSLYWTIRSSIGYPNNHGVEFFFVSLFSFHFYSLIPFLATWADHFLSVCMHDPLKACRPQFAHQAHLFDDGDNFLAIFWIILNSDCMNELSLLWCQTVANIVNR